MKMNSQVLALALLTAGEQSHAFSATLPSYFTIRSFALCADNEGDVVKNLTNLRSGYKPAILFGAALAGIVSFIAKSPLPLVFALGTDYLMVKMYENAIPPEKRLRSPLDIFTLPASIQPSQPAMKQGGYRS